MNTKIGHCNLKPFVTLNCEDLEFSSEGVSVAFLSNLMFRHEQEVVISQACYVRSAGTKLHTFDKNPDLKRSK